jgi:hypothetical protein
MATIPLRGPHSVSLKQCARHISGVANQFATTSPAHTNRKTTKVAAYSDESPSMVNGFARKCTPSQLSVASTRRKQGGHSRFHHQSRGVSDFCLLPFAPSCLLALLQ